MVPAIPFSTIPPPPWVLPLLGMLAPPSGGNDREAWLVDWTELSATTVLVMSAVPGTLNWNGGRLLMNARYSPPPEEVPPVVVTVLSMTWTRLRLRPKLRPE